MEAFASDATWEFDLLGLKTSYDKEKNSFCSSASSRSTVRHVIDKKLPSLDATTGKVIPSQHDLFTGIIDGVTGEIIHGTRNYACTGEVYEGPFSNGGKRHGEGAIVQNFFFQMPKPSFATDYSEEDELITRQQLPPSLNLSFTRAKFFGSYRYDMPFQGTLVTDTFTYVGAFQNRMFHGAGGELIHADGSKFIGDFVEGLFSGQGHETDRTGEYHGEFRQGLRHGQGRFDHREGLPDEDDATWSKTEGYSYEGTYRRGMKHGEGTERTPEGDVYKGSFQFDKRHGSGRLRNRETGIIYEGTWLNGEPIEGSEWRIRYPNGDQYVGSAKDYLPHGHGLYRYENGDHWAGEFRDGRVFNAASNNVRNTKSSISTRESLSQSKSHHGEIAPISVSPHLQRQNVLDAMAKSLSSSLEMLQEGTGALESTLDNANRNVDRHKQERLLASMEDLLQKQGARVRVCGNGDIYLGYWDELNGRNGHGIYFSRTTGCFYFGRFYLDKRHGFGVLIHPEIGRYAGEFRNDKKVGMGTLILSDKSSYHGNFVGGAFHGKGTMKEHDGTTYVGEWSNGLRSGEGLETNIDGTLYSGGFKDGKRHGKGTLIYKASGRVIYTGEWLDGLYHGQGILVKRSAASRRRLPSVTRFEGGFSKGLKHGFGTFINGDGFVCKGNWSHGRPVQGNWRVNYVDGSIFSGQANINEERSVNPQDFSNLLIPFGFGTFKYANGDVYCGNFIDGKRTGTGTCAFVTGEKWEGEWTNDHMDKNGGGVLTTSDGEIHEFPRSNSGASLNNASVMPRTA